VPTKEGKITIRVQQDACIDGTLDESHLQGSITGNVRAEVNANGMDVTIAISLRANIAEKRTVMK
jgi:hypothetical protein